MGCSVKDCLKVAIVNNLCSMHHSRVWRTGTTDPPKSKWQKWFEAGVAVCPRCKTEKVLSEFNKDASTKTGVARYCRSCNRTKGKGWYARHADQSHADSIKRKFGLSSEAYADLLNSQQGGCAICGRSPEKIRLAVDHCHKSGQVRGLLCDRCNRGLGMFKDNPENLQRALSYLQGPSPTPKV